MELLKFPKFYSISQRRLNWKFSKLEMMIAVLTDTGQELKGKVHELMNRRNTIADRSTRSTGLYVIAAKAVGRKEKSPGCREGKKRGGETVSERWTNYEGYISTNTNDDKRRSQR